MPKKDAPDGASFIIFSNLSTFPAQWNIFSNFDIVVDYALEVSRTIEV